MSTAISRRSRKRLATRQAISDAATRLFVEHGFDAVTIDQIAEAADVGRMTVFNHFPRKEEMFFDRDAECHDLLRAALRQRDRDTPPIEALRLFAHRLALDRSPYADFTSGTRLYVEAVERSETLKARARAMRDEFAGDLAAGLADCAGRAPDDPMAHLAAGLLVSTFSVAFVQAHRDYRRTGDAERAKALFLATIDRGASALETALAGSPYARPAP